MSKAPKNESQNKYGILPLLSYCPIGRAANLLGCEVNDLLHLWEEGEITLYWNLNNATAILMTKRSDLIDDLESDEDDITQELNHEEDGAVALYFERDEFADNEVPVYDSIFYDCDGKLTEKQISLYGMWYSPMTPPGVTKILIGRTKNGSEAAIMPVQWQWPPVEDMCIMQHDIRRLINAIDSGNPLNGANNEKQLGHNAAAIQAEEYRFFETKNTCKVIVELLLSLGFKKEELANSSNGLQIKIAAKGYSKTLSSVSERTVRDWMRIGGAR